MACYLLQFPTRISGQQAAGPCVVTGKINYRDQQDSVTPDSGAVVILLPKDAKPDRQADPEGLHPDQGSPGEDNSGILAIREIGGAYGRANDQGQFKLSVTNSKQYYVLCISSKSGKQQDNKLPMKDSLQISSYFFPAEELIGASQYRWQVASIEGTEKELDVILFE